MHERRGIRILRSSHNWHSTKFVLTIGPGLCAIHPSSWKGNSANFALTEFSEVGSVRVCAAFLLQHLLAGASDLDTDEPKGG
jgi:hypothetical protein